jgi:hypothetical protein
MGWCSGTEIFDRVLDSVLEYIPAEDREKVIERIAIPLWEGEWDCETDSDYWYLLKPIYERRYGPVDE